MQNTTEQQPKTDDQLQGHGISFKQALLTWLKISLLSFGGPAGQISLMHKIIVEEKKWISEQRFLHALNYCMLLPGPEAQQLAIYLGWLMHRTLGGVVAGVLFILPGALVVLALSILYAGYQQLSIVAALFYGIKAAVLAIVVVAVIRIGEKVLKNHFMFAIAGCSFIGIYIFSLPFPMIVITAGILGFFSGKISPANFEIIKAKTSTDGAKIQPSHALDRALCSSANNSAMQHIQPSSRRAIKVLLCTLVLWLGPLLALSLILGSDSVYSEEATFFSKMAVVTFGGAYAVLAYVAQQAVGVFGWLNPGEMLDGLAMAEATPGPLIMVVQFVGFMGAFRNPGTLDPMLAGSLGALVTTWVTFVPCFLWIFLGAPYVEAMRSNQYFSAALSTITAAIVGVIINLALWFSLQVIFAQTLELQIAGLTILIPNLASIDLTALLIATGSLIAMQKYKLSMFKTLTISASVGVILFYLA